MKKLDFNSWWRSTMNRVLLAALAASLLVAGIAAMCSGKSGDASQAVQADTVPVVFSERGAAPKDAAVKDNADELVYVTKTGKKYHREGCRWATKATPIALGDAVKKYEPCSVCVPPKLTLKQPEKPVAVPAPKQEERREMPVAAAPPSLPPVRVDEATVDVEPQPKQRATVKEQASEQRPVYCPPQQTSSHNWSGLRIRGRR